MAGLLAQSTSLPHSLLSPSIPKTVSFACSMSPSQFLQGKCPPSPRLSPESSPPSGEAGEDSGPYFTGEKIETQRERPEVRQGEALRSAPPPLPSPSPPGQRHFLLLRGLWGPRAAGGAPNGSWGLCVWQRQLGLLEPNPHSECEWEVGEGEQQLAPGPVPVRNLCGVGLPWDCLSVSLFWPLSLYLPLPICLCLFSFCFFLCLCLSISLCVCLCLSRSLPLCVSLSICLSSELGD